MCHSCERNVARRILPYFRTITQSWIKDARPRKGREEDDEREQRWQEHGLQTRSCESPRSLCTVSDILIISRLTRYYKTAR